MSSPTPASEPTVVAIDGPSGSGKSSTARGVARRLGLAYLDTGAMYRALAWLVLQADVEPTDTVAIANLARHMELEVSTDPQRPGVQVNGHDVTEAIRSPQISAFVSTVSTVPAVREHLVRVQQEIVAAAEPGIVLEGRDTTTVVAPQAEVRVLLVADPSARMARRLTELGDAVTDEQLHDQVVRRDADDSTVARFTTAADGVVVIDSTQLSLAEVVDEICALA
ncbi:cytidylate kinase [Parenemella sanctibonifatiensis]|uniref:Cytidylate kinase n=1 Tax=Parenemella sanctibonifatiensis TaxID=2016505 RepID=A0A255EIW4_9ACTN|nr:cytidylate kinase [Parenemella sanctibonifatiensis]